MPARIESMRHPSALLHALDGLGVKPPKSLQGLAAGFELLGPTISAAATDPASAIVDAALAGTLSQKQLDDLLSKAAAQVQVNLYRQEFRLRADRNFGQRFHEILKFGAADAILDSLRPQFDTIAEQLNNTLHYVDLNNTPHRLLNVTATPEEQSAWAKLPELVRQIDRIGAVAAVFAPRGDLPVIDDLSARDGLLHNTFNWYDDRALMCCPAEIIVSASNAFRSANPTWQTSPWLRVTLKLATIAEAQETFRVLAEQDFDVRASLRSGNGTLTENGFVPDVVVNPHKRAEVTA